MFRQIQLTPAQESEASAYDERCASTCEFLYPLLPLKIQQCIDDCKEKTRDLPRLATVSFYGAVIALSVLACVIVYVLLERKWQRGK